jgi:hypothetical protein
MRAGKLHADYDRRNTRATRKGKPQSLTPRAGRFSIVASDPEVTNQTHRPRNPEDHLMNKPSLTLQPSEAVVVQAAAAIYAAYIYAGRVEVGREKDWMQQSIQEALWIARTTDDSIRSDSEVS